MSNMTEFVRSMISDLENIQRIVSLKLNELKRFAKEQGVDFESKQYAASSKSSIAMEIEQQRKAMMEQMQKIRDEAQQQAQKAMEEAKKYSANTSSGMPSMPTGMPVVNMPNFGVSNINIEDVKEKKDV